MLTTKEDLRCGYQALAQTPFLEVRWRMTGCLGLQMEARHPGTAFRAYQQGQRLSYSVNSVGTPKHTMTPLAVGQVRRMAT